jgi:hypothetical protein
LVSAFTFWIAFQGGYLAVSNKLRTAVSCNNHTYIYIYIYIYTGYLIF